MRYAHRHVHAKSSSVFPWMLELESIKQASSGDDVDATLASAALFEQLEVRQFRLRSADHADSTHDRLTAQQQELQALTGAVSAELALAAQSAPQRLSVAGLSELLRLEDRLTARLALGQTLVRHTSELVERLRDVHTVLTREPLTTHQVLRTVLEHLQRGSRLLQTSHPLDLMYWLLLDLTPTLDLPMAQSRSLVRPILNALCLLCLLPEHPQLTRDDLLTAALLSDLALLGVALKPSRRIPMESQIEKASRSHVIAALGLASGIRHLPSHIPGLIEQHHTALTPNSTTLFALSQPQQLLNTVVVIAQMLANHQSRLPVTEQPLSSEPETLRLFDKALQQAQAAGCVDRPATERVKESLRIPTLLAALPHSASASTDPQQRLEWLLQQGHLRVDAAEAVGPPKFEKIRAKPERKRRLTSYPGLRKRV